MIEKIIEIIADEIEEEKENITPGTKLVDDLDISSMVMLTLAITFENEFGVRFSKDDIPLMKTPDDICELIKARMA